MRILFPYPQEFGTFPDLYEYVTLLRERGIESHYVGAASTDFRSEPEPYVSHLHVGPSEKREFSAFARQEIATVKPDIVHTFHYRGCGLLPITTRIRDCKWIVDVRTIHVETRARKVQSDFWLRDRLTWLETQTYDRILVLTNTIQNRLSPSLRPIVNVPLGASKRRLNPPDQKRIRLETRGELNIPQDVPLLLYAGSLSPTRRMDKVLAAYARVLDRYPTARFLVIGGEIGYAFNSDPSINVLARKVKALELQSRVVFTGRLPYSEVAKFYVAADIGISYTPKGTPFQYQPATKLIEYMMAGLIPISNNVPAVASLLDDDVNGYVVGESVEEIAVGMSRAIALLNPEKRELLHALISSARNTVRDRDWELIVDRYLIPIYEELCGA